MTKHSPIAPHGDRAHDYLPATGHDAFLPFYDLISLVLGGGEIHRRLLAEARLAAGLRVLEIGCGTGNLAIRAARSRPGLEVVGCDPDPRVLERAQRKARRLARTSGPTGKPPVRFERGYAQRLPYPDASFDGVLSALMWHHLPAEAKAGAAAEVARVLRPGGSLHLADFVDHGHGLHGRLARRFKDAEHPAATDDASIVGVLAGAGLDCVQVASSHNRIGAVGYYRATRPADKD